MRQVPRCVEIRPLIEWNSGSCRFFQFLLSLLRPALEYRYSRLIGHASSDLSQTVQSFLCGCRRSMRKSADALCGLLRAPSLRVGKMAMGKWVVSEHRFYVGAEFALGETPSGAALEASRDKQIPAVV